LVGFLGTENQSIIEKRDIKLNVRKNLTSVKIIARGINGGFIETIREAYLDLFAVPEQVPQAEDENV